MSEIIDKVKEKAKDVKDAVVDTTKDVADKAKDTVDQSEKTSVNSTDKEYEEGVAGTNKNRQSDPLTQYSDKEPMTPAKIKYRRTYGSKERSKRSANNIRRTNWNKY